MSIGNRRLVARASRGDVDAFSKLVQEHSGLVHRAALRILGAEDAQDASQEVWSRVWANIKNFRGESTFSTWLYRITMNTCLRALRKKRTQETWELGPETVYPLEISGEDDDPEEAALGSGRRNEVLAALRHVRAEHRAALVLRHMEGLSYVEIAEVLGIPDGTAKGWASRGRAAMLVALLKKTTAATERGGGRRQTPANQEETGRRSRRPEHAPRASAHTSLVLACLWRLAVILIHLLVRTYHERISDSQFFPSKGYALIRPVGQLHCKPL